MIFQDPLSALNPLMRIEDQIKEGLSYHTKMNAEQRQARALELLEQVGFLILRELDANIPMNYQAV